MDKSSVKDRLFDFFINNKGNIAEVYDEQNQIIALMVKGTLPWAAYMALKEMRCEVCNGNLDYCQVCDGTGWKVRNK